MRRIIPAALVTFVVALAVNPLYSQTGENRAAVGAHVGISQYFGTFDQPTIGPYGELFLRYNIIPQVSVHLAFAYAGLGYDVDDETARRFPEYFGQPDAAGYLAAPSVARTPTASINTFGLSLLGSYNILPKNRLVPYVFAGIGWMAFDPQNADGQKLPNNQLGVYNNSALQIPFGVGLEAYLSGELTLNAKLQGVIPQTDWLDDFDTELGSDPHDYYGSFSLGLSYYFYGTLDCDEDGLSDTEEQAIGTDPCNPDTDGDLLTDFDEVRAHGTSPLKPDTDDDGLGDRAELFDHKTDPRRSDTDDDGLIDGQEIARGTDPLDADSDKDGLSDGDEVLSRNTDPLKPDTDGDGLNDGDEVKKHRSNPLQIDTDGDGLNDGDEVLRYRSDPTKTDTDGDELADGEEVNRYGSDPVNFDTDGDSLSDGEEVLRTKTNPTNPDTDGDGINDGVDRCPLIKGVRERDGCPAPPKPGTVTNFPAIYFIVNTDQFDFSREETTQNLVTMLEYINQCPELSVIIEGHASREGSDRRNEELSLQRAERVKAWLVEQGVDPNKIEATFGYGSRKTAVDEPDPNSREARQMDPARLESIRRQNRRIAIIVARTCR